MKNNAIRHVETANAESVWILETNRTAYVFGLNQQGGLQHMYWGPKLVLGEPGWQPDCGLCLSAQFYIFGSIRAALRLQGLTPNTHYRIEGETSKISGAVLMGRGLPISLRGDYSSQLIRIHCVE